MPTESDYRDRIRTFNRASLLALWDEIEQDTAIGWEGGKALEYTFIRAFELDGAQVKYPFDVRLAPSGDDVEQIDGAIYVDGLAALVEVKDTAGRTNIEPIAKLRNQLLRRPAGVIGCVFSRSGFTDPATTLARYLSPQTILLWEGREFAEALRAGKCVQGLTWKYRYAVENGLPDYNLLEPLLVQP